MVPVENCTGCAACRDRCPRQAIEMREDLEGFLFPAIDSGKCNHCGTCTEVCPVRNATPIETLAEPMLYAAWSKDREILRRSSSGGVFSEIARVVLDRGGVVFGAAFDGDMRTCHVVAEAWGDLDKMRGSKYVQSDVGNSYQLTRSYLDAGCPVLYTGTPCQIAGLYAMLGGDSAGLLTCSLICHGVPSPKVFRMYLDTLARRYNSRVRGFSFRNKRCGWKSPTIKIELENGRIAYQSNIDNPYNRGFVKNLFLRRSYFSNRINEAI